MKWWIRLLLDPQAGELGGGGGTPPASSAVNDDPAAFDDNNDPSPSEDPTPSEDPSVTPASTGTPATTPTQGQGAGWQSIRDVARARGFDLAGNFQDDGAFLDHLLSQAHQARQSDFHARLGQQLAPHASRIQQFLGQQQPQPQADEPKPWEAPEFDERWLNLVERDPATGIYIAKPGADPAYAAKVNKFAEWKAKYDRNPAAVLNSMVDERAKKIAADTVREQLATQGREHAIQEIVRQNSEWLYQRDAQGQPVRDYLGQPMLSPVGTQYMKHLAFVKQSGVNDPRQQDMLAKRLVQADHYATQQAQGQQGQPTPQQRAATNAPPINPIQAQPPSQRRAHPHDTPESNAGRSLSEMLRESLATEGVTDDDVRLSIGG